MALESASTIYDLNPANPPGSDQRSEGDNHVRLVKTAIQGTFKVDIAANRPAAGTAGRYFFASDDKKLYIDDGTQWVELTNQSPFTTGDTRWTLRAAEASGWVFLNGRTLGASGSGASLEGTAYQSLYNLVKTLPPNAGTEVWGVDVVTMPDARKRVLVMKDDAGTPDTDYDAVAETGGAKTKTIAEANLPAHTHGVGTLAVGAGTAHKHSLLFQNTAGSNLARVAAGGGGDIGTSSSPVNNESAHTHPLSGATASIGSGTALDVKNPYMVMHLEVKL